MAIEMEMDTFEALVEQAIAAIPESLLALVDNCIVVVEDDAPSEDPSLLGLYEGVPITERDSGYSGALPDRITIFRNPTLAACSTHQEVVDEVSVTVVHEIAHHFGIDDDRLHALGWA